MRTLLNMWRCLRHGKNAMVVLREDCGLKANVSVALVRTDGEIRSVERSFHEAELRKRESHFLETETAMRYVYVAPFRKEWI